MLARRQNQARRKDDYDDQHHDLDHRQTAATGRWPVSPLDAF
jgi:hypothetical protein